MEGLTRGEDMTSMLETRIQVRQELTKAGELSGLTSEQADWLVERIAQARKRGPVRKAIHDWLERVRS
jgi:hypothetical protein